MPTQRKSYQIDIRSLEEAQFDVVVMSRYSGPAGFTDYLLAFVFLMGLANGLFFAFMGFSEELFESWWLVAAATGLFSLVVSVVASSVVRKVRQRIGKKHRLELSLEPGTQRRQPGVRLGKHIIEASAIKAVGLLGWQEVAATDRVWDVTLLLDQRAIDVICAYPEDDLPRRVAQALASAMNVEMRESSTTGGPTSQMTFDQRGRPNMN